jgi:thymidine kinase
MYIGPMFAGKTTRLIQAVTRAHLGGLACVVVKYANDTRYGADRAISTHDDLRLTDADGIVTRRAGGDCGALGAVDAGDADVVAVDEGQFHDDLAAAVERWTREGRGVYVAALDGDYNRRPFDAVSRTIPLATEVTKLTAVCMFCSRRPPASAPYTVRIAAGDQRELIGGRDAYRAACPDCYRP